MTLLKIDRVILSYTEKDFVDSNPNRIQLEIDQVMDAIKDLPQAQCDTRTISKSEEGIFTRDRIKIAIDFERTEKQNPNVQCPRASKKEPHKMHEWSYMDEGEEHHVFCAGYVTPLSEVKRQAPDHLKRFAGNEKEADDGTNASPEEGSRPTR